MTNLFSSFSLFYNLLFFFNFFSFFFNWELSYYKNMNIIILAVHLYSLGSFSGAEKGVT